MTIFGNWDGFRRMSPTSVVLFFVLDSVSIMSSIIREDIIEVIINLVDSLLKRDLNGPCPVELASSTSVVLLRKGTLVWLRLPLVSQFELSIGLFDLMCPYLHRHLIKDFVFLLKIICLIHESHLSLNGEVEHGSITRVSHHDFLPHLVWVKACY